MPSKFLIRLCAIKVLMHRKQDLPQVDKDDHQGESTSVRIVLEKIFKKTRNSDLRAKVETSIL